MSQKKPSLGRGLEALLGQISANRSAAGAAPAAVPVDLPATPGIAPEAPLPASAARGDAGGAAAVPGAAGPSAASPPSGAPRGDELARLPLDVLQRGRYQPRVDMRQESLEDLANSIRSQGLIQPIVVRPVGPPGGSPGRERYEIIAGERRWRAAQIAGLATIPAVIRRVPDEAAIAMALIENIQREDLNPLEEARALDRLIREFGVTHQQAADAVGRSRAAVSNLLRLLELAPEVAELVEKRALEMGHARALLGLPNRRQQAEVGGLVSKKGLSVRETEALVRRLVNPATAAPEAGDRARDPNVVQLEARLADTLGARVSIEHSARSGKGKVVVSYNSLDELDGILAHIN
ncbi:MAG: ParB/RepB/Spo0J family partition protein [Steroidobacteraceae bacterium]|jgi:ParB family chromosome partitioning protein|nr:ParB/RepB/Spo0J family partition protein [Steroidobacteraceae bacterium]